MNFNDIFTNKDGRKFKLVVILDRDFKKGYTTSDVLSEVKKRGYVIPDKEEAYALKLDKNLAKDLFNVWILVVIYRDKGGDICMFKNGATIVSGILHDREGQSIPDFGRNANYEWKESVGFIVFEPVLNTTDVELSFYGGLGAS